MKTPAFRFTLYAIIIYLTGTILNPATAASQLSGGNGTHLCGVTDNQPNKRYSDQFPNRRYAQSSAVNLNVGESRTVRLIYFLPNDRTHNADVVQNMKADIRTVQTFYAEQMGVHGFGNTSFRLETDPQGELIVHRVNGEHADSHYLEDTTNSVIAEIEKRFDIYANIYFIVIDNSINGLGWSGGQIRGGVGSRRGKHGGYALKAPQFGWGIVGHELGHAFGLWHDFRDGAYIMSYGPGMNRLSACHAEFLSVHPYFNADTPIEKGPPPSIELVSSHIYPAESKNVPVRLRISDSDELHQVFLHADQPNNRATVKTCRGLRGKNERVVDFDYDGIIPLVRQPSKSISRSSLSFPVHPIRIEAVDVNGDVNSREFVLLSESLQPLLKISGDNQHGLPNTPLPVPFVVEVRDLNDGSVRNGVPVTFTVTAGGGTLSKERTETDGSGVAESLLTLGAHPGINTVEVSAAGMTVTFTAAAGAPVEIPDPKLRAVVENTLSKAQGQSIAPAEMARLTELQAPNANISDLTGLEHAINLRNLNLSRELVDGNWINSNSVSDLSPLSDLTSLTHLWLEGNAITDISPVTGLVNLVVLHLGGNTITDISPVTGLVNLTKLVFWYNDVTDISVLAGLTNLETLYLDGNPISDISVLAGLTNLTRLGLEWISVSDFSPLAELTNLTWLRLRYNTISDLSPLVANTGLGSRDEVDVRGNPLSYLSIYMHIPTLQSRGVTVEFDNRAHPAVVKISGDNQTGASLVPLSQPFVVEVQDEKGSVVEGISVTFVVTAGGGTLSTTITRTDENGRAQSTLILGPNLGTNTVEVSATGIESTATFYAIADSELPPTTADVNNDGFVNVLDLILIASSLGQSGQNDADINRDRVVSILDLVLAAGMFEDVAAAPSAQPQVPETLTAVEVQGWLTDARSFEANDPIMKRGIMVLEQLLVSLTPTETELLANYPNPFNPETWIPYRLAEDAFVTLTIYDGAGQVVRALDVGHRIAAAYENRSKAIYWDGRNHVGEQVASGVYFYHLSAGIYSATRRMVILK